MRMKDSFRFISFSMEYTVVEMYVCNWNRQSQHDGRIVEFLRELEIVELLDPRPVFYGRKTVAT